MGKTVTLSIIGAVLGIPLSYYFQPDVIQSKLTLSQYVGRLPDILSDHSADFVTPMILSIVICAVIGGVIGWFMDEAARKNRPTG